MTGQAFSRGWTGKGDSFMCVAFLILFFSEGKSQVSCSQECGWMLELEQLSTLSGEITGSLPATEFGTLSLGQG